MNRKEFLRGSLFGLGSMAVLPTAVKAACSSNDCSDLAPSETAGPFPIKDPASLVRDNIVGDRSGIALVIDLTILDQNDNCSPLGGVYVDLWHCDAEGNYSEYGGTGMQSANYTGQHFLRGRSTTDANGKVSFVSIFPGWYQGRAPHIHLQILDANEQVIRTTQIAFEKNVCDTVYSTSGYNGSADTLNASDNVFSDSLALNMYDSISGNNTNGYTLCKSIVVNANGFKAGEAATSGTTTTTTTTTAQTILSGVSGTWYAPEYDGSGFQIIESTSGLLLTFYGYSADSDGDAHWLVSSAGPTKIVQGQSYDFTLYSGYLGNGGSLTRKPNVGSGTKNWGTMTVTFNSCTAGTITIAGDNKSVTQNVVKLANINGISCTAQ